MAHEAASSVAPTTVAAVPARRVRVALAQLAPTLGNVELNAQWHEEQILAAKEAGAQLIVFPELSLTGYYLRDIVPDVALDANGPLLARLAAVAGDMGLVIGFVEAGERDRYYNSAVWFERGQLVQVHRKVYLPTYGLFDERRYFAAGHRFRALESAVLGRVGLLVCEDLWHVSAAAIYQADEVDWLVCVANSPARGVSGPEVDTAETYRIVTRTYATLLGAGVIVVNRAGVEEGLCFWGGSMVVGPSGEVLGQAPAFDSALTIVDVDLGDLRRQRIMTPLGRDSRPEVTLAEFTRMQRRRYEE